LVFHLYYFDLPEKWIELLRIFLELFDWHLLVSQGIYPSSNEILFVFLAARWQIWIWKTETLEVCQQHFIFVFPLGIHLFTWFHNIMPEWLLIYSRFQTLKSLFIWIWMKINCYIKTSFNLIFKLRKASKWELEKFGPCGKRLLVLWSTNQNERAHLETAANFFKKYRPPFHIDFIAKEVGALRQEKTQKNMWSVSVTGSINLKKAILT